MIVAIPAQGITAQWLKRLQGKQMKIRGMHAAFLVVFACTDGAS